MSKKMLVKNLKKNWYIKIKYKKNKIKNSFFHGNFHFYHNIFKNIKNPPLNFFDLKNLFICKNNFKNQYKKCLQKFEKRNYRSLSNF